MKFKYHTTENLNLYFVYSFTKHNVRACPVLHHEGNDMRYALLQGKSVAEVTTYVTPMVQSQVDAARVMSKS